MCKSCNDIELVENLVNWDELLPFINQLLGKDWKDVASVTPSIWRWVESQYLESMSYKASSSRSYVKSSEKNIYNYSLAKAFSFNKEIKMIKKVTDIDVAEGEIMKKAQTYFGSFQNVENNQVKKITEVATKFDVQDDIYLEYVARMENTRNTHAKANKTTLRKSNPWWKNTGLKLLSEWGCNCTVDESIEETPKETKAPKLKLAPDSIASDIDIDSGKAIIFKEDVGYFNDVDDTVTRKRYKKV